MTGKINLEELGGRAGSHASESPVVRVISRHIAGNCAQLPALPVSLAARKLAPGMEEVAKTEDLCFDFTVWFH